MCSSGQRRSWAPFGILVLLVIIYCLTFGFPRRNIVRLAVQSALDCPQDWQDSSTQNAFQRKEPEDLVALHQFDQKLIEYLRMFHVYPPSERERRYSIPYGKRQNYNVETPKTISFIQKYLKNKTNGIFVEAGANNGADAISNTLILERDFNWTGLLVEGSPIVFPRLRAAHRRARLSDLLLSSTNHSKLTIFRQKDNAYSGKAISNQQSKSVPVTVMDAKNTPVYDFELLTVPLYSLTAACELTTIDFLSLDVEGTEDVILKAFPFDKIFVKTMIVEVNIIGERKTEELAKFLEEKGFKAFHHATPRDTIFIHKSLVTEKTV